MTLSSIGNVTSVFQNMGMVIDPYFFLEQYVPHIDWQKFKQSSSKYQAKASVEADLQAGSTATPPEQGGV